MSYILTASSGISTPVSIANGGTGETTATAAMTTLSSAAFQSSAVSTDWGTQTVDPSLAPDAFENYNALNNLITALQTLGVII